MRRVRSPIMPFGAVGYNRNPRVLGAIGRCTEISPSLVREDISSSVFSLSIHERNSGDDVWDQGRSAPAYPITSSGTPDERDSGDSPVLSLMTCAAVPTAWKLIVIVIQCHAPVRAIDALVGTRRAFGRHCTTSSSFPMTQGMHRPTGSIARVAF